MTKHAEQDDAGVGFLQRKGGPIDPALGENPFVVESRVAEFVLRDRFRCADQLSDIGQQVRYRLLECIENLRDRKWRATIDEVHLRRWNHPDSVMLHWKNSNLVHAPRHSIQGRSRSGS